MGDCVDSKYWIFGGYVLATCLHQGGISALQWYCEDERRYRLKFSHFNDMAMKAARLIYFTMVGIPLFSYMVSRLVVNGFIDGFYADRFFWGNVAMFCIAFDVYELSQLRGMAKGFAGQKGRIAHHVLELAITLSWYTNYPSPMLVFAGGYVVVANTGFIFPVLIRMFPMTPTTQARFGMASIFFIFGSMLVTDACIIWFLANYWAQTTIPRVISALAFAVGFTSLDAVLCRGYFWPLVQKARAGKLYSPPPRPAKLMRLSSSRSNLDTWIQEGTDMFTIHSLGSPVGIAGRPLIKIPTTNGAADETITTPKDVEMSPLTVTGRTRTVTFADAETPSVKKGEDDNENPERGSLSSAFGSKEEEEMVDQVNSRIGALLANKGGRQFEKCPPTDPRRNGDFDLPTDPHNDSSFVFSDDSRMFTDESAVFSDRSTMRISTTMTSVDDVQSHHSPLPVEPTRASATSLVSGVNYSPLPPEQRVQTRYPERPEEDQDSEWSKRSQELNQRATMQLVEFAKRLPATGSARSSASVPASAPLSDDDIVEYASDDQTARADSVDDEVDLNDDNTSPFDALNQTIYAHVPVIIPEADMSTEASSSEHSDEVAIPIPMGSGSDVADVADEKELEMRSQTHRISSSSQPLSPTSLSSRSMSLNMMSQTVRTHTRKVHSLDLQQMRSESPSIRSHRSLHSLDLQRDSPFNSQSRRSGSGSRGSQIIRLPETFEAPPAAPLNGFATAGKDEVVSQ